MATKTKKVAKKATSKVKNDTNVVKKINAELVNASLATINTVVDNGEKWQKLASKLIKKSEKVREQQINMVFDTAEAVKGQFLTGTDKMKDLVGIDTELVGKAKDMAINNPVSKKVIDIVDDITEKVTENPMVQKAEKATGNIKNMGIAKFNELKGDVLEQASKIIDKGEAIIEDAKTTPKAKVTKKAKATVKKATKPVTKKATATKKTVVKAAPKAKAAVAKKVTEVKKETVAKVTEVKNEVADKVAEVKAEVKKEFNNL